uniref:F-box domain-containing protein n=1 Tax=Caenorhabditis tropicalis TaxID=1561998 RepID=A0A1I7V3B8_9PELO
MKLPNFPLLVLEDVFETMEFRERFLISVMSKRAKRMTQTSMPVHFVFNFTNDLLIHVETNTQPSRSNVTDLASDHIIGGEVMRISLCPDRLILRENTPQKQRDWRRISEAMTDQWENTSILEVNWIRHDFQ